MKILMIAAIACFGLAAAASAQSADQYNDLKQQVDALKRDVEALKTSPSKPEKAAEEPKLEWGGFGEMAYENFGGLQQNGNQAGLRDQANLTRISLDGIYTFNDWIKSKFEFEALNAGVNALNANSNSKSAALDIEQAYMDFKFSEPAGVRAGLLVVPMGLTNEHHRPTDYVGTLRPSVETFIIPSTWRELGAGLFGAFGPDGLISYRTDVVTGLQPAANGTNQVSGMTGSQGIKGTRSLGALSFAQDGGWVARADVNPMKHVFAGGAYYIGRMGQGVTSSEIPITIWETHAYAEYANARLQALYAEGHIANAASINAAQLANSAKFTDSVGNKFWGGYASLEYNVVPLIRAGGFKYLSDASPYVRYERYATSDETPLDVKANPANSRVEYTTGLELKPIKHVIVKGEYQWLDNQARTGIHEWNLGLGYQF